MNDPELSQMFSDYVPKYITIITVFEVWCPLQLISMRVGNSDANIILLACFVAQCIIGLESCSLSRSGSHQSLVVD